MATSLKWVFAATMIIVVVLISGVAFMEYTGMVDLNANPLPGQGPTPTPVAGVFSGPITVKVPFYLANNTAATSSGLVTLLHADHSILGSSAPGTGLSISGTVSPSDNGMIYMLVSANGNTTFGNLYSAIAASNPSIVVGAPTLYTYQGVNTVQYQLNVGTLSSGAQGNTAAATTTVNIFGYQAVTPTLVSLLNTTSATASASQNVQTISYINNPQGTPAGSGTKILRMQVTASNSTDASAFESQALVLNSVTINFGGGVTQTFTNFKTQLGTGGQNATDYIEVISGPGMSYLAGNSLNNEFYGIPAVWAASDASQTLTVTCSWSAQMSQAGTYLPVLTFTYVGPTGVTGTFSHNVSII